jgi:epoxyqueuosine reductase
MHLDDGLRELAEELGRDFFGVADLLPAHEFIQDFGGKAMAEYPRAVSIGIALLHPIVDQLPNRAEKAIAIEYRHHAYDVINERLDHAASRISSML